MNWEIGLLCALIFLFYNIYLVCVRESMCVCIWRHACYHTLMEVRGQFEGASLFPLCGSQGSNLDHQAWQQCVTYQAIMPGIHCITDLIMWPWPRTLHVHQPGLKFKETHWPLPGFKAYTTALSSLIVPKTDTYHVFRKH